MIFTHFSLLFIIIIPFLSARSEVPNPVQIFRTIKHEIFAVAADLSAATESPRLQQRTIVDVGDGRPVILNNRQNSNILPAKRVINPVDSIYSYPWLSSEFNDPLNQLDQLVTETTLAAESAVEAALMTRNVATPEEAIRAASEAAKIARKVSTTATTAAMITLMILPIDDIGAQVTSAAIDADAAAIRATNALPDTALDAVMEVVEKVMNARRKVLLASIAVRRAMFLDYDKSPKVYSNEDKISDEKTRKQIDHKESIEEEQLEEEQKEENPESQHGTKNKLIEKEKRQKEHIDIEEEVRINNIENKEKYLRRRMINDRLNYREQERKEKERERQQREKERIERERERQQREKERLERERERQQRENEQRESEKSEKEQREKEQEIQRKNAENNEKERIKNERINRERERQQREEKRMERERESHQRENEYREREKNEKERRINNLVDRNLEKQFKMEKQIEKVENEKDNKEEKRLMEEKVTIHELHNNKFKNNEKQHESEQLLIRKYSNGYDNIIKKNETEHGSNGYVRQIINVIRDIF